MRHNFSCCFLLLALSLFIPCSCQTREEVPPTPQDLLPDCSRTSIQKYLESSGDHFPGDTAEALANRCGMSMLPVLKEMLEDESLSPRVQAKTAMAMGKLGAPESGEILWAYIDTPRLQPITQETASAIVSAMVGLGWVGTEESIDHLKQLAAKDYWLGRRDESLIAYQTPDEWRRDALYAIQALGPPKAIEVYRELLQTPAAAELEDDINSLIRSKEKERNVFRRLFGPRTMP